ncbi:MAG: hypothetical protein KatS3mg089_0826 [Patescibacteria group bacterium]|nr:MAG: hypothetical protein KatS3mg089_0826 [Patescibacteria group bacterium]
MASKEINQIIDSSLKKLDEVQQDLRTRSFSHILSNTLRYALGRRGRMRIVRHTLGFVAQEIKYAHERDVEKRKK